MNILITGAKGFIGKNLIAELCNIKEGKTKKYDLEKTINIFEYDIDTNPDLLDDYCKKTDFVFHLAGVNRPKDQEEFMKGNFGFTSILIDKLKKYNNTCPIMISSSIQAEIDNDYGKSKKAGENLLLEYAKETGSNVFIYRFPNVFGKWCRPNYNSAVVTFCNNIAHNLPIKVNDPNVEMVLIYIDDLIEELIFALMGKPYKEDRFCKVRTEHKIKLGEIVDILYSFKESRKTLQIPNMENPIVKKLYSTYLSYLPTDKFSYPLKMNIDNRGSFTEILKSNDRGQVSVNISKAGITKGNHWHHTKNEKFLVVKGKGVIRFRKIDEKKVHEYFVSDEKLEVIDIPVGYTHNIENLGESDMVTIMWVNEIFDPNKPDTYFLEV